MLDGSLKKTLQSNRLARRLQATVIVCASLAAWAVLAASPTPITTEVAATGELTAEIRTLLTSIEQGLATEESYTAGQAQLKQQAIQIAIFAQALADHADESPLKKSASALRDAALAISRVNLFQDAKSLFSRLQEAADGKTHGSSEDVIDWGKLARTGAMMQAMKERSGAIRRGLRKPRDSDSESRNAMAIALMALVVHGDARTFKDPADKPAWREASLELQGHMSRAAAAIKSRNESAADHFRLGMEACDKCHQRFKP